MTKELAGKIAFVTGSGRGLGRVMADRLAELGADVAIHDLTWTAPAKYGEAADLDAVAKVIARHGGRVVAVSGNIGDKAAVAKMREEIEAKLGRVDILVNCAGGDIGAKGGKPEPNDALGIPLEDIRALTENNLYGTILVCQAFVPPMVEGRQRIGDQHRLGRGAIRGDERGHLCGAQGRRHPLYALPRQGAAHRRRARQCGEPGRRPRRRASRRRGPSIPRRWIRRSSRSSATGSRTRWPTRSRSSLGRAANIIQRPGASGRRRRIAVSWMSERLRT